MVEHLSRNDGLRAPVVDLLHPEEEPVGEDIDKELLQGPEDAVFVSDLRRFFRTNLSMSGLIGGLTGLLGVEVKQEKNIRTEGRSLVSICLKLSTKEEPPLTQGRNIIHPSLSPNDSDEVVVLLPISDEQGHKSNDER